MDVAMPDQKYLAALSAFADLLMRFGPLLGAFALIIFVIFRTKSFFFVFYRVQGLIGGAQAFHDERVQRHWKSFEDMHRLNLWFGLNLTSPRAMHQLIAWLDRHKIGIGEIAKAVPYFDTNTLEFFYPATWHLRLNRVWVCASGAVLLFGAVTFAVSDYALFYVKKTNTPFWVNAGHAFSIGYPLTSHFAGSDSWHLDREYCLFTNSPAPLENALDKAVICHLIVGERDGYVQDTIQNQYYLSAFLVFMLLLLTIPPLRRAKSRKLAHNIHKSIEAADR